METVEELPSPYHAQELPSGLKYSLALHAAIALIVLLKTLVFPGKPIAYIPALRVDLVGLPEQLKSEIRNPTPLPTTPTPQKEAPKPTVKEPVAKEPVMKEAHPKEPDEIGLKKSEKIREKRMESSLARIKALAKISSESPAKAATAAPVMGNKISKGTSLSKNAQESDQANYVDTLQNALQQNWTLPMWLERQQLNAKVMIFIDSNGRLIRYKFLQTSGSAPFDEAVKRTLLQSQPFPAPPPEIASSLESNGVMVGFPL